MSISTNLGAKKALANDLAKQIKAMAKQRTNAFLASKVFKDRLREVFADADSDNDGWVSHEEVYTMVLQLYLFIAQYTTINKLLVPSRARVEQLYDIMDADGNGVLDFGEFQAMAILLVEDMAARVGTQVIIKSVLGPLSGWVLVEIIHTLLIFAGIDIHYKLASILPEWVFNEAIAVTACTTISTMFFLPYMINLIDRVMHVQAKTGVMRDLAVRARTVSINGGVEEASSGDSEDFRLRAKINNTLHNNPGGREVRFIDGTKKKVYNEPVHASLSDKIKKSY